MKEMVGREGERRLAKIGMEQMMVSMGHQPCGAVTLWNYPRWMRNLVGHDVNGEDRPDPVDMAALESNSLEHLTCFPFLFAIYFPQVSNASFYLVCPCPSDTMLNFWVTSL